MRSIGIILIKLVLIGFVAVFWIAVLQIVWWKVDLVDIENPHYPNADNDRCQKVTFQTRWWFVLNILVGSAGQSSRPFDIGWGWHGAACSLLRHSCRCSQAFGRSASPLADKDQSHKWIHVLQTIIMSRRSLKLKYSFHNFFEAAICFTQTHKQRQQKKWKYYRDIPRRKL